jgi:hypothetical protein
MASAPDWAGLFEDYDGWHLTADGFALSAFPDIGVSWDRQAQRGYSLAPPFQSIILTSFQGFFAKLKLKLALLLMISREAG